MGQRRPRALGPMALGAGLLLAMLPGLVGLAEGGVVSFCRWLGGWVAGCGRV
jgi:hypothetical protein